MIAAIFDHHHQTSNIQHEIAFRHAVQMVNENRWVPSEEVKEVDIYFWQPVCSGELEGGREGGCFTIANCRGLLAKTILHKKAVQDRHSDSNKLTLFSARAARKC